MAFIFMIYFLFITLFRISLILESNEHLKVAIPSFEKKKKHAYLIVSEHVTEFLKIEKVSV